MSRRTVLTAMMTAPALVGLLGRPARALEIPCLETPPGCTDWDQMAAWVDNVVLPIPDGKPIPLADQFRMEGGREEFRRPFPAVPVWNPPGQKRVGIQAGHWNYANSPDEYAANRQNPGSSGGGRAEWQLNLDLAQRVTSMLEAEGVAVDLLDGTPPIRYRAHAFVSLHADGDVSGALRGYKMSGSRFSATPKADELLNTALWDEYEVATGLARDPNHVSNRMTGYYAFNARRYQHAIAPGVPHSIVEMGFLTNVQDRAFMFNQPDRCARGVVNGILKFLAGPVPR